MGVFRKCDNCPGEIIVGMYEEIRVPKLDAEGNETAERITLRLPQHRARVPESVFQPGTEKPHGYFAGSDTPMAE